MSLDEEHPDDEGEEFEEQPEAYFEGEDVDDVVDTPNEKLLRTSRIDVAEQPESYRNNTQKEELLLQYVANFRRQFEDLYPKRKPLMLCPRNECGMRKFICTSVRPTQVPFIELYDYDKCAAFVADFIKYEQLELPIALPQHMPSPTAVIEWQAGDCFDMAQLLCSLLLGVGYDAYVVSGYAPRAITTLDQSATAFPTTAVEAKKEEAKQEQTKYKVRPMKSLESNFLKSQAAKREAEAAAALRGDDEGKEDTELIAAQEAEELDDLKGQRVHAWVLVLAGKRMLEESVFLEPTTGIAYAVEQSPYYGIESLWSAANYWVNMQKDKPPAAMSYDLQNLQKWERVLTDTLASPLDGLEAEEEDPEAAEKAKAAQEAAENKKEVEGEEPKVVMEMAPSWVQKLVLNRDRQEAGCPGNTKAITYRKGRLQKFAPYSRADGLIQQLTIFADSARTQVLEVRQTFSLRKDKLATRVRYVPEQKTHEIYEPGRPWGLREHIWIEGLRRELHFSCSARLDGLMLRVEEFGKKCVQTYDGSKDNLIYRSVSYRQSGAKPADASPETSFSWLKMPSALFDDSAPPASPDCLKARDAPTHPRAQPEQLRTLPWPQELASARPKVEESPLSTSRSFRKMAEKYKRDPSRDAEEDVAKRTYELSSGAIKVLYHYGDDRVTASFRHYSKDGTGHVVVQVDPFSRPPADAALLEEFQKLQQAERDCINEVRDAERQAKEMLKKRAEEEQAIAETMAHGVPAAPGSKESRVPPHLLVSVYDTQRHKYAEQEETDEEKAASQVPHDYLTPFLPHPVGTDGPPLAKDDAFQARDGCLKALKERLVERANIVQSRLDEENAALSKRQAAFQRNRDHMDPSDEAEYERYCQEAMFRIQILEQRLDRHTELSLQKYAEMDARLRDDPRLVNLKLGANSR